MNDTHASEHAFAEALSRRRRDHPPALPPKRTVAALADGLLELLFPALSDGAAESAEEVQARLALMRRDLRALVQPLEPRMPSSATDVTDQFSARLPALYERLLLDAEAINAGDPAAESLDEVIAAYPGFLAIAIYRIAHEFSELRVPLLPRLLTEVAHTRTGIDIHPGATIGRSLCIDHGTGIVVGETAVIGDDVKLYQGVTLGALSVDKGAAGTKRHPTIEDRVVLYANATVLGGRTTIGHDSVVGGNVWLTESVPPYSLVLHRSEVRVRDARTGHELSDFVI